MGKISFSLILGLALVTIGGCSGSKCVLSGTWRSSLGCKMTISALSALGEFSGFYHPATMVARNDVLASPLHGAQQDTTQKEQPTFGFTVKWLFSESPADATTVFVGQCFVDDKGEEALRATWLMRAEVGSPKDNWKAVRFGTNSFTRIK